ADDGDPDTVLLGSSSESYQIPEHSRTQLRLSELLYRNIDDCAFQDFRLQLLDHLLARIEGRAYSWDGLLSSPRQYAVIDIFKDQLHFHGTAQFNYTTYDVRRGQDSIKPTLTFNDDMSAHNNHTTRSTVMLASSEDDKASGEHPFWYARVLSIFHVNVRNRSNPAEKYTRMDVLWVRWLGRDLDVRGGWKSKRLDRIGYVRDDDAEDDGHEPGAFGFVNPRDVIRCCHLIPAFHHQTRQDLLPSASVVQDFEGEDYCFYYINRFVDRDMSMRYRGGGIGHVDPAQRPAMPEHYDVDPIALLETERSTTPGFGLDEDVDAIETDEAR
ncbi:hypothetical protein FRB95_004688, partial [Tulasnella sp. JGI-2019a]